MLEKKVDRDFIKNEKKNIWEQSKDHGKCTDPLQRHRQRVFIRYRKYNYNIKRLMINTVSGDLSGAAARTGILRKSKRIIKGKVEEQQVC